jgi:FMN phosphatase YigB (HAD superfamily)
MTAESHMESVEKLAGYLTSLGRPTSLAFGERVQRAVVLKEANRLVERMDAFKQGELDWLSPGEAWEVMELARSSATMRSAACAIRCDRLREVDETEATEALNVLLGWVDASPLSLEASLILLADSEMDVTKDPEALRLAVAARLRGWSVAVGAAKTTANLLQVEMHSATEDIVSLKASESSDAVVSSIRFGSLMPEGAAAKLDWAALADRWREVGVPEEGGGAAPSSASEVLDASVSVSDLFGEQIMLRDIEPRSPQLDGIEVFRDELGWDETFVPRKNEPQYAQALLRIMSGPEGNGPERIVYVGDTLLNDGGAIRGLQAVGPPGRVWGFLCGAVKGRPERDFVLDRIYFGREWHSLRSFMNVAQADGLILDSGTWVLFDLDQTVYAAKGRDDEALLRARWDGVRGYLESIVPAYKFDAVRAEALYREFDRDEYHPVTRDNLDYVVLLVLAVAAGLADAGEIRDFANSSRPSIGMLADELRRRAAMRLGHEDIGAVLNAVKAVSYNTANGDQTPCKDFRRYECLAMAARMYGDVAGDKEERIFLNREVVDLIGGLRKTAVRLFAVSDRPLEAAVAESEDSGGQLTDLMTVPMAICGGALDPASSHPL